MKTKEELVQSMRNEMESVWIELDEELRRRVSYGHEISFVDARGKIARRVNYDRTEIDRFLISKLKD
jgi:hypothetical protein